MKLTNPRESKIKRCTLCSVTLEIKKVNSLKGNCYISNYNNKIYKCNKCFITYTNQRKKKYRTNKTVGSSRHLNDMRESARQRARKYNIPYDIKVKDLREIITERCPILGIKFELNKPNGKALNNWQTSPSLDRIVPDKGYTKDNIIIVSMMANSIKTQATPKEIQKVATFYKKLYDKKGITYETY